MKQFAANYEIGQDNLFCENRSGSALAANVHEVKGLRSFHAQYYKRVFIDCNI